MDEAKYGRSSAIVTKWCVAISPLISLAFPTVAPPVLLISKSSHFLSIFPPRNIDEPVELKQIQDSLIAHVKLDPPAAIGVLCDHCSLEADLGVEEKEDRERLRKLVLLFLSGRAKEAVFAHFHGPKSEAEEVFRNGLIRAISGADVQDTEIIVKDLLMPLESFVSRGAFGDEVLSVLLDKARATYTAIKSQPGPISLKPVEPYLSLLEYVAVEKKAASIAPLLRFYSTTLIGKIALEKLDQASQIDIVERVAVILAVSELQREKEPALESSSELAVLRNTVVTACPHLFEKLVKAQNSDRRKWQASVTLLKACRQRQEEDLKWTASNLISTLALLNTSADQAPSSVKDLSNDTKILIKALHVVQPTPLHVSQPKPPASLRPERPPLKRKFDSDKTAAPAPPRSPHPRSEGGGVSERPPSQLSARIQSGNGTSQAEPGPRGPKLINRLGAGVGADVSVGVRNPMSSDAKSTTPELLRRISSLSENKSSPKATSSVNLAASVAGSNRRSTGQMKISRVPPVASGQVQAQAQAAVPSAVMPSLPRQISIKGAALKALDAVKEERKAERKTKSPPAPPSLMARMSTKDDGNGVGDGRQGGKKRRRPSNNKGG